MRIFSKKQNLIFVLLGILFAFMCPAARSATICNNIGDVSLDFGKIANLLQGAKADGDFGVNCRTDSVGAGYCLYFRSQNADLVLYHDPDNEDEIPFTLSGGLTNRLLERKGALLGPLYDWGEGSNSPGRLVSVNLNSKIFANITPQATNLQEGNCSSSPLLITYLAGGSNEVHSKEEWRQRCQRWDGASIPVGGEYIMNTSVFATAKFRVGKYCSVFNGGDIAFGKQALLDRSLETMGAIDVDCSKGTHFFVSINNGLHAAATGKRAMQRQGGIEGREDETVF